MSDISKDIDLMAYILIPVKIDVSLTKTDEDFIRNLPHNGLGRNVFVANKEVLAQLIEKFPSVNKLLLEALVNRFDTINELLVCLAKVPLEA